MPAVRGATVKLLKVDRNTLTFSDGTQLAGHLDSPLDIYLIPDDKDRSGWFYSPHRAHWQAVLFNGPASVKLSFRVADTRITKTIHFRNGATIREFIEGVMRLTQQKASKKDLQLVNGLGAGDSAFKDHVKGKGNTYGAMLGDHVFLEGLHEDKPGVYTIKLGS